MNGKLAVVGTYDGRCIFYETEVSFFSTPVMYRTIVSLVPVTRSHLSL